MEKEKKTQTLAMKVQSSLLARLSDIAETEDRPIGYVARELMMRGLALYESDGRLRDSPATGAVPRPAPVVARIEPAKATGADRKSTRLNSSHIPLSRMPSSA